MTVRQSANGHRPEPPHRPADWNALGYRPAEGTTEDPRDRSRLRDLADATDPQEEP